ncbi:MAG: YdcF family protein [Candidatus Liptonbacteria bacterium]|nr:YdcF family protein [Candidatus Liptonbacteria bacterium]
MACWVEGDRVGVHEWYRIHFAVDLARGNDQVSLVLTGGKPPNGREIHAEHIKWVMLGEGLVPDESRLIISDWAESSDTFRDVVEIIRLVGSKNEFNSIVIVTSWYHAPRVAMIVRFLQRNGFRKPIKVAGVWHTENLIFSSIREVGAICLKTLWQARWWCRRNRAWLEKPTSELPPI